jgi:hypothetical protein
MRKSARSGFFFAPTYAMLASPITPVGRSHFPAMIATSSEPAQLSIHSTGRPGSLAMTTFPQSGSDQDRHAAGACSVGSTGERRLHRSSYGALGRVYCEFQIETGVLRLRGSVPSYYLKQLAQELVLDLEGVRRVDNQICVAR